MSDKTKYPFGHIYGLYNKDTNELLYVGMSVQILSKRLSQHKTGYIKYKNIPNDNSCYAKMNILIDDFKKIIIKPIETFTDITKDDLSNHECKYIKSLTPICNIRDNIGFFLNSKIYSITNKKTKELLFLDLYFNNDLELTFNDFKKKILKNAKCYDKFNKIGYNNLQINLYKELETNNPTKLRTILNDLIVELKPKIKIDDYYTYKERNYLNNEYNYIYHFVFDNFKLQTAIQYFTCLKIYFNYCFATFDFNLNNEYSYFNTFNDKCSMKNYLEKKYTIKTAKNYITAIYSIAKKMIEIDSENKYIKTITEFDYITNLYNEYHDLVIKEDGEQNKTTDYVLQDIYILQLNYTYDAMELLWLHCNTLILPRRRDWQFAIFVEKKPDIIDYTKNYVILGGDYVELDFYNFKTYSSLKNWNVVLKNSNFKYYNQLKDITIFNPEDLSRKLKMSFNLKNRTYVFDREFNYNSYSIFINSILKTEDYNFKQTDFRHILIDLIYEKNNFNYNLKKDIAYDMGQKYITTQLLYSSIEKEDEDIKENVIVNEVIKEVVKEIKEDIVDDFEIKIIKFIKEKEKEIEKAKQDLKKYKELKEKY